MKNLVLFLLAAVLIVSCKKQADVPAQKSGDGTSMTFNIALPSADPVTYAIQTNEELQVKTLEIYQYDNTTKALDAVYKSGSDFTFVQSGAQISATITSLTKGQKTFLFVANNDGKASISGTLDAVKGVQVTPLAVTNGVATSSVKPALMMTAETSLNLTGAPLSGQLVTLKRIMSRIDIRNMEPALMITKATLKNTADRSFVFPQTGANGDVMPATAQKIALPTVAMPAATNAEVGVEMGSNYIHYSHIFYPYINAPVPGVNDAAILLVEGKLKTAQGEVQVKYEIPLKINNSTNYLQFSRNVRYTLVIENAYATKVQANVVVDLWKTDLVTVELAPIAPVPYTSYVINGAISYNFNTAILTSNASATSQQLMLNRNTDWTITTDSPSWISVRGFKSHEAQYYSFTTLNDVAEIGLTANTTGAQRTGTVTLTSTANTALKTVIQVTQSAN